MTLFEADPIVPTVHSGAVIDGPYRYLLWREWDSPVDAELVWLMLNPSTADADQDDQTIRRVVEYSRRAGANRATVLNLFAYRATDPRDLLRTDADIVGPSNDIVIRDTTHYPPHHPPIPTPARVVLAWGGWCPNSRAARVMLHERIQAVTAILGENGCELLCLGQTASGAPRHPSRGAYVELQPWR